MKFTTLALAALAIHASVVHATPALMSAEWTAQACDAWNRDEALTSGLGGPWIRNDANRGYKIIHLYRTECGEESKTELKIMERDSKAMCVYGGAVQNARINLSADYTLHASTERWKEIGAGHYGPIRAVIFGRLKLSGPKMEALSVADAFEAFMHLPAKIPGDKSCPTL